MMPRDALLAVMAVMVIVLMALLVNTLWGW